MKVDNTHKLPIKLWLDDMEDGAMAQAKNLANFPFAYKHIAIMPDSHQGYGMPIGGVMATKGVIVPNAVGVDIGCGMCAVKTSLKEISTDTLKKIMGEVRKAIPVGPKSHRKQQDISLMPKETSKLMGSGMKIVPQQFSKAMHQLGTLGGGNHFIEIQKGDDGYIWIMIHSGSRNLGYTVANHYNKLAQELNEKYKSSVPKEWELAFLPLDTDEGQAYVKEMNYCVEFALANRRVMMAAVSHIFQEETNCIFEPAPNSNIPLINIAHNYASLENHFGKDVWVHRKGATLARKGTIGIIPGSQGTKSYIVEGKGNPESFYSCSHGAGRKMGRKQAQRTLDLAEEQKKLEGVIHSVRNAKDLDEAPGSYKDITTVMENQTDLVDIKVELTPLAVVKG